MTTQTPAVVAAHIASTHRAVAAVTASLDAAVSALADSDAVSAEDAIRAAKAKLTAAAVAARRLTATIHRVQRPGKTAIEAQLLRGDPAGVIAELFVITQLKDHEAKVDFGDVDAVVRLCWPAICSKYDLPEGHPIPAGCRAALGSAWSAYGERNGTATHICHVHFAYANVQGLSAALRR